MAFRKSSKNKNFTVVDNEVAQHDQLSMESRGLLVFMLSLPDDWIFHRSWLQEKCPGWGREKLQKVLKELELFGYLVRTAKQSHGGKMSGWIWEIFAESCLSDAEKQALLKPEKATSKNRQKTPKKSPKPLSQEASTDERVCRPSAEPTVGEATPTKETVKQKKQEEVENAEALHKFSDEKNEQKEHGPEGFDIESIFDHVIAMMAVSNETDILFVKNKVADYADYLASRNKRITRSGSLAYAQRGYQQHLATQRRSLKLNAARDAATDASVEALQMKAQRTLKTAHNAAYRSGIDADPYAWTLEDYELINESLVDQ